MSSVTNLSNFMSESVYDKRVFLDKEPRSLANVQNDLNASFANDFSVLTMNPNFLLQDTGSPYLMCNEVNQEEVLQSVAGMAVTQNGCHVGFASWLNYDIIAMRSSKMAFICDIDPHMFLYYSVVKECVLQAKDRTEFIALLKKNLQKNEYRNYLLSGSSIYDCYDLSKTRDGLSLSEIYDEELTRENGWLSKDESFEIVQQLYKDDRIYHCQLDITDESGMFSRLNHHVEMNNCVVDTLYASNIFEWLTPGIETETYRSNTTTLMREGKEGTIFIDALYPSKKKEGSGPPLRVVRGKLPNFKLSSKTPHQPLMSRPDSVNTEEFFPCRRLIFADDED